MCVCVCCAWSGVDGVIYVIGKQIVGYLVKPGGKWEMIGNRSPQDPQVRMDGCHALYSLL